MSNAAMMVAPAGGAAPPDPSAIFGANLVAWWKRSTGIYDAIAGGSLLNDSSTDATEIGRWEDSSGNGFHLTRTDPASMGTGHLQWYTTTETYLGHGMVHMDGSSSQAHWAVPNGVGTALYGAGAGSIFITLRDYAGDTDGLTLWDFSSAGAGQAYAFSDHHIYETFGTNSRFDTGSQIISISGATRRYSVVAATNDWTNYLNNSQQFHSGTNTVSFRTSAIQIGSPGAICKYNIGEIVIAKVAANSTQRGQMDTYLST